MRDNSDIRRLMGVRDLKSWLTQPESPAASDIELQRLLRSRYEALPLGSRAAIPFVFAVLRDMYVDDAGVHGWLLRPRREFRGSSAADYIRGGRAAEVEALVVKDWNLFDIRSLQHARRGSTHEHRRHPVSVGSRESS